MMFEQKPKTIGITKEQEWAAWKRIKQGGHGVVVDQVTIEMIEANPRKYLEPLFHASSYGYRPGKSARQAIDA
jgi:hypothetical protein